MKNFIIAVIVSVIAFAKAYSQQFTGVATYQTQRHMEMRIDSTTGMTSEMQKSIQEQLRKQFQKTYKLTFNDVESLWKEEAALGKPQAPSSSGMTIVLSGNSDIIYQNTKENLFVSQSDLFGKLFLVKDSLKKPYWKLEKEIKNIGQYTCFKATHTEEVEESSFTDGDKEPTTMKIMKTTTAWYTLDIPVQHGPENFWGLPGLILEVNDGKMAIMCTQVVINPKEPIDIEPPSKGKEVNQTEYDTTSEEKAKEMTNRFHNNNSKKSDGHNFSIKIGG